MSIETKTVPDPSPDRFYKLEYRVVYIDAQYNQTDAVFHEPGKMGFSQAEMAQHVVALLEQADEKLGEKRTYEILPVMVSEKYQQYEPSIVFDDGDDEEAAEMARIIELANRPPDAPPSGNTSN
jgi:hypothetical protein